VNEEASHETFEQLFYAFFSGPFGAYETERDKDAGIIA